MHDIIIYREKKNLGYSESAKIIRRAVIAALKHQKVDANCIVNVMLTDDVGIHIINLEQRGVDSPTDVLSFPINELQEGNFDSSQCEFDYDRKKYLLGDVVINLQRCATQALEYGHSFAHEVSYLSVHSILHLLGYDHLDEGEQKQRMRMQEEAIMETIGL